MKKIKKYIIYFIALNLLVLGMDKFFLFIPDSCTLLVDAPKSMLYTLGVIEVVLGILLCLGKYTRTILVAILVLMISAIVMHMVNDTYDIGGAVFLILLVLIPLMLPAERVNS